MLCLQDFPPALYPNLEVSLPLPAPAPPLLGRGNAAGCCRPPPPGSALLYLHLTQHKQLPVPRSPGLCTQDIAAHTLHHARGPSTLHRVSALRTVHPEPCTQSPHTAARALHLDPAGQHCAPQHGAPQPLGPCTWQPGPCTRTLAPRHRHLVPCTLPPHTAHPDRAPQHSAPQHLGHCTTEPDTLYRAPRALHPDHAPQQGAPHHHPCSSRHTQPVSPPRPHPCHS